MNQSLATVGAPAPSPWRRRIALVFFVVGVLAPVLGLLIRWLAVPGGTLIGLFVLGGEFWDKVHALFVHDAKVVQSVTVQAFGQVAAPVQVGVRFYIGAAIFAMGFLLWGLVPLASGAGWSGTQIASFTGGFSWPTRSGCCGDRRHCPVLGRALCVRA